MPNLLILSPKAPRILIQNFSYSKLNVTN